MPVRLIAIPEGGLQGFTDEVFDLEHVTYVRETAIDIPGPETRYLGDRARRWNVYIMRGQRRATRRSRTASSTSAAPSIPVTLFTPVADPEIGRLGVLMANEGSSPESARGLALNGAEVVYRASYPRPPTGNEFFEIQNHARALDNNFYVVAPNLATDS